MDTDSNLNSNVDSDSNSNVDSNSNRNTSDHDDDEEQKKEDTLPCTREIVDSESDQELKAMIGGGIWMKRNWVDELCQCKDCWDKIYTKHELEWLFENVEESEGNSSVVSMDVMARSQEPVLESDSPRLSHEFSKDEMMASSIAKLPRRQALDALNVVMKGTDLIKQRLKEFLSKSPPKKVITSDD